MADIRYTVQIDASTGAAEIKKLEGEFEKLSSTTKDTEGAAKGLHGGLENLWKQFAIGNIMANAAQKGLHFVWSELKSIVDSAAQAELADKRLESTLFSTGRESAKLSEHFRKQAEAMMKVSTWDDEVIKGAQTMLLQLTNLDAQGIDRATKGAMGLASVFSMELGPASELVANWMRGNTDRLSKYGIHVKDTWTEEQKRNEIMRQLLIYYQRVLPDTETYSGRIMQLKNSYGELKEEMGRYFTENVKLDKILGEVVQGLRDFFNAGKDWRAEQEKGERANIEWGNRIYEAAKKAGMSNMEIQRMIYQFRELTPEMIKENELRGKSVTSMAEVTKQYKINADNMAWAITQGKYGTAMKEAYLKVEKEYNEALEEQARKQKGAEKGAGKLVETIKFSAKAFTAAGTAAKYFTYIASSALVETESKARHMGMVLAQVATAMQMDAARIGFSFSAAANEMARKLREEFEKFDKYVRPSLEGLNDIFYQFSMNRSTEIENEYTKRREAIEKSKMDEEKKLEAFAKLDEEYEIKRRKAKRVAFISQKAIEIGESIMATARAFTQALPNIPLAILVAALGAAKTALIIAQPVPLKTGAIFEQPTLLPAVTGKTYLAGEAGREIVASPENLREAIFGSRSFSRVIHIHVPVYIGAQKIKEQVVEIVERTSVEGTLKIAAKAIRE